MKNGSKVALVAATYVVVNRVLTEVDCRKHQGTSYRSYCNRMYDNNKELMEEIQVPKAVYTVVMELIGTTLWLPMYGAYVGGNIAGLCKKKK